MKLRPCPFCGNPNVVFGYDSAALFEHNYICCTNCGASSGNFETKEKAIKAWNRRVRTMKEGVDNGKD